MNYVYTSAFVVAAFLLAYSFSVEGNEKKEPAPAKEPSATVDFASLDRLKGKSDHRIRVRLEASNGAIFTRLVSFENQAGVAGAVCDLFAAILQEDDGWNLSRNGNRLTITTHTDKQNRKSVITKIRITSENTLPLELIPLIITTGNVKAERDANPAVEKK